MNGKCVHLVAMMVPKYNPFTSNKAISHKMLCYIVLEYISNNKI